MLTVKKKKSYLKMKLVPAPRSIDDFFCSFQDVQMQSDLHDLCLSISLLKLLHYYWRRSV